MRNLTATLTQRYLLARLSPKTDLLARLSILEGAAGVPAGTWLKSPAQGALKAKEHFGGGLHPSWLKAGNSGLLDAAVKTVQAVLSKMPSAVYDADSYVQSYLIGMSPVTMGPVKSLFWAAGSKIPAGDLQDGKSRPLSLRGTIIGFFRKRAIKDFRTGMRSRNVPTTNDEGQTRPELERGSEQGIGEALSLVMKNPRNPLAQKIRRRLQEIALKAGEPGRTFAAYLELLQDASTDRGVAAKLPEMLGITKGTVSKHLKKMQDYIVPAAQKDPTMLHLLNEVGSQAGLGYGARAAKKQSLRDRLASRYVSDQHDLPS